MQKQVRLAMNPAAWFFVGESDGVGAENNVPIKTPFRIGRNQDSDLCLPCQSVSGTHAEIREENGQLWLKDLNSTNGTFVNGTRIQSKCRLGETDTVQFGTIVFHISNDRDDNSSCSGPPSTKETLQNERFERLFQGGVVPFVQPVMDIGSGKKEVIGYEVLGRSKLFGLRTPAQMFAAAQRLEMEAELSRVLRQQGIKIADSSLPAGLALFLNTHQAEMACDGLEESLFEMRENHPDRPVVLEIHESVLDHPDKLSSLYETSRTLDIQLAFHDFGAGKIRLAQLADTVPDIVKFDVQLIKGIDKASSGRQRFVASLVKMVTELGITPLAECIEQTGEHETLQQLGFQLGQGFLYARPTSVDDCTGSKPEVEVEAEVAAEPIVLTPQVKSFLDGTLEKEIAAAVNGAVSGAGTKSAPVSKPKSAPATGNGNRFNGKSSLESAASAAPLDAVVLNGRVESGGSADAAPSLESDESDCGAKGAGWLLSRPGHFYTIQVLSAISLDRAQQHVAMQSDPEQFAIFCKKGKTRPLFIVVCGLYEDRAAAKDASAAHANSTVSPWVRMLSSIHDEIRSA